MPKQQFQSNYNRSNTSPGGAGSFNLADGSEDVQGVGWAISDDLLTATNSVGASGMLVRPSDEAGSEQRSAVTGITPDGAALVSVVRGDGVSRSGYWSWIDPQDSILALVALVDGAGAASYNVSGISFSPIASYTLDLRCRTNPAGGNDVVSVVYDSSGNFVGSAVVYGETSAVPSSGVCGLACGGGIAVSASNWATYDLALRVGIIGDSLYSNTIPGKSYKPAFYLQQYLQDELPEESPVITDQSIGGTATGDWLPGGTNYNAAVAAFTAAGVRYLTLRLGGNDARLSVSASTYGANLASIVNALTAAGFIVFLEQPSFPVPGSAVGSPGFTTASVVFLQQYEPYRAALHNGSDVLYVQREGFSATLQRQNLLADGVHPNDAGAQVEIRQIAGRIATYYLATTWAQPFSQTDAQQIRQLLGVDGIKIAPATTTGTITARTNLIGTNAADSPNAAAAQALIGTNLNATVASRSTYAGGAADANAAAIVAKTNLIATNAADGPNAVAAQGTVAANLDAAVSTRATVTAVWSAATRTVTGSTSPLPTTTGGIGPYALNQDGGIGTGGVPITVGGIASSTDCLRVVNNSGTGIAAATLRLYLATDATLSAVLGAATTGPDGRWLAPIYCPSGTYQLVTAADGEQAEVTSIVVP